MLQQTQVDRVLPKYAEWLEKYPSLDALADAPEHEVTKTWYPLGYNIRPKRLQSDRARVGGALRRPAAERTRRRCCRSRASAPTRPAPSAASRFASARRFSTPTSRACCFASSSAQGDPKSHAMKRHLWTLSETLVPMRHVFDFNQALMDFGAMVCVARNPKCLVCPMAKSCRAYPFTPDNDRHRRHRGGHRARRPRFWSRGASTASISKASGSFPAANATGRDARRLSGARAARRARRRRAHRRECSRRRTPTRIAASSCISSRANCSASRGRSSVRRCDGSRAASWATFSSRPPTPS